ncbi:unnamed protein product [Aphanomyces euteiches]
MALNLLCAQAQQAANIQQDLERCQSRQLTENSQLVHEHAALIEHVQHLEATRQNDFRAIASQLQEYYEQAIASLRAEQEAKYLDAQEVSQRDRLASNLQLQDATSTISHLSSQLQEARDRLDSLTVSENTLAQREQLRLNEVETLNEALMHSRKENEEHKSQLVLATQRLHLFLGDLEGANQRWLKEREALHEDGLQTSEELSACYSLLDESRARVEEMREALARETGQANTPCANCVTLKAQLSEERALHNKEVANVMMDNHALLDRERRSAEQMILALQSVMDRLKSEDYTLKQELQGHSIELNKKQAELQATLTMIQQATIASDASYERAIAEQNRLRDAQERLKHEEQALTAARAALSSDRARFLHQSTLMRPDMSPRVDVASPERKFRHSRPDPHSQRSSPRISLSHPSGCSIWIARSTYQGRSPARPFYDDCHRPHPSPTHYGHCPYGYPYSGPYPPSGTPSGGPGGNDPDRGSGGGGGSPPPNPPNPSSYPTPAPAPAPRGTSPTSLYADCKKFAPTLDTLDQRRYLEFFLRRFDELAIEYHLSEEQLLLVFSDRLVSSKIERAADWWMRLHEDEPSLSWTNVKELFRLEFIVQTLSQSYRKILEPHRRDNESIRSFIWRLNDSHQDAGSDAPVIIQGIIEGCGDSAISNLLRQRRPRPRSAKECIRLLTDCDIDINSRLDGSRAVSKTNTTAQTPSTPTRSPRQVTKPTENSENVILQTIKDLKTELRADMLNLATETRPPTPLILN